MNAQTYDLLVIGGGINGAGIARDAVGRGLSVLLVEQGDLASATSQWSTKLIHGGLRYLEHYEFRLVSESLAEREVLLHLAPHLVHPLAFVLPHEPHLRPAWMIRAGLFLYDHIGGRRTLPGSFGVRLDNTRYGAGLKERFQRGFVYSDARVDDARLVLANAVDASEHGAQIRVHTRLVRAMRDQGRWLATLEDERGLAQSVSARAIVNAAGPWVKDVLGLIDVAVTPARIRHVKGSHIVVPRVHAEAHAYLLQNADNRIVFVIPYQQHFSLIGTTDIPVEDYAAPRIDDEEIGYLLGLANAYLAVPLTRQDIVWTYSGVRPLYDDGTSDASEVTRDYVLEVDSLKGARDTAAPIVSVFGGKLTTYRRLAEDVLDRLAPFLPSMRKRWTAGAPLPGGDYPAGGAAELARDLAQRYPALPPAWVQSMLLRHGTRTARVLGDARKPADLGTHFGGGLTQREIEYFVRDEWARSADDVLWRRSKLGLDLDPDQRAAVAEHLAALPALA